MTGGFLANDAFESMRGPGLSAAQKIALDKIPQKSYHISVKNITIQRNTEGKLTLMSFLHSHTQQGEPAEILGSCSTEQIRIILDIVEIAKFSFYAKISPRFLKLH